MDTLQPLSLEEIKKLVIIAMFFDNDLMDRLVLKGGNAMDIVYAISSRASVDIDLSIENEFRSEEMELIKSKMMKALRDTFGSVGYAVFDINFNEQPKRLRKDEMLFWGGYHLDFKIIEMEKYKERMNDIRSLRKRASFVGPNRKQTFRVDISKFEYCGNKQERDFEGYTIYVYTPEMLVIEKLRAICQQMPEYRESVKSHPARARARDFFDIYVILENFNIELSSEENKELFRRIFDTKRVPLGFIDRIGDFKEYHRPDFSAVRDTVKPGVELEDFDYYFDYVVGKCKLLKSFWEV